MSRRNHCARSKKKERAVDSTPVNTPCNTTILSSVRLNGKTCYTVYNGGTTQEKFAEYLIKRLMVAERLRKYKVL